MMHKLPKDCICGFKSSQRFLLLLVHKQCMRATDSKILEELEMVYDDKDCFASIDNWSGTAKAYWINLERLLLVADNAKKQNPVSADKIQKKRKLIVELFNQTRDYANAYDSKQKEKSKVPTEDYSEFTTESWDALNKLTASQEKLRRAIMELIDFL